MHEWHPQLSPCTLTGAPSQYNQSCKMLICFFNMHILINSTSNFQSAIFYRNTAKGTKGFHQILVDLPPSRARKEAKERVGEWESLFIYTTVYLFTYPSYYDLPSSSVPVLLLASRGSLVPQFPWVAWIVGSVAGCWVCRKANWNVYPCTYRNCRNKCWTWEDRDMCEYSVNGHVVIILDGISVVACTW